MNQESYNDGKCICVYRVVGDSTRYEFLRSGATEEGGELLTTLEVNEVRNLGEMIGHTGDLVLSGAKKDGQAQFTTLELDHRRVACRHALGGVVLYSVRLPRLDFGLVQTGIRVLVREGGCDVVRLLPQVEIRGHVEDVARKRGVTMDGV